MMQLALDFEAPAPTKKTKTTAKKKPPLLQRDVVGLTMRVQVVQMWMSAGFSQDTTSLTNFADELEGALEEFEAVMAEKDCPLETGAWFAAYAEPVRKSIAIVREGVAKRLAGEPPKVEFKSNAFDAYRWSPRQDARYAASRSLYPGTKTGIAKEQALVHHWRLCLEDAKDLDACHRRIAWHEAKVVELGGVLEPAIVINTGLPMIIAQPVDRREIKDRADAVRYAARKAL